jgi:Ca2+-transporting ATPase
MEGDKKHINYYSINGDEVTKQMQSNLSTGLSDEEAELRLKKYGENKITESKKRSPILIFLSQFKSPIVYLLLFATALSFYFKEWLDGFAILVVILINAVIGFYMEFQAERSMDALKKLTAIPAKILRKETLLEYDSVTVVPGDIIYAESGDMIPADARILRDTQLQVDESTLTGESVPIEKKNDVLSEPTSLAERVNMLYKGTHITKGNVWAIVTDTGMDTELGKVASLVESADQSITPLEKKLEDFSKKLIIITLTLVVIIFIAGLLNGKIFIEMLQTSIALAVAAIPEGLPIVATLALAQGMVKMARHKVIVKKLSAVETLGGTNVICTDKTGTLTENKIKVSQVVTEGMIWNEGDTISSPSFDIMRRVAILCNTAELKHNGNKVNEIGDPLETGLLKFAKDSGENVDVTRQKFPKINEEPFSSETKMMATMHRSGNEFVAYAKGAVEELVKRSTYILRDDKPMAFDDALKQHWLNEAEKLASSGLRIIAGAYKECADEHEKEFSSGLTFVGLFGMMDPPRKEVYKALEECREAGIRVVMITGDHPSTAKNIGTQLGIAEKNSEVIIGSKMKEYDLLSEEDKKQWSNASIFARVSPKQKLDLVKVLQEKGNVVGMTGDGVNDAPALKKADIGIAMGLRGTQVAQEVADMILKDDSFSSIVTAIKQGRIIFENIQKFVIFLLSCNLSELLVIAIASIFSLHFQLFPLQILFINLITDVLPALALGVIDGNDAIMKQKPKPINTPIIDSKKWWAIIFYSIVMALTSVGGVLLSHYTIHKTETWNPQLCNNILFFSLIFSQLLHVLNMGKTGTNYFKSEVFTNRYVWLAIVSSLIILFGLYLIDPVRQVLSIYPMSSADWMIAIGSAITTALIIQIAKTFKIIKQ